MADEQQVPHSETQSESQQAPKPAVEPAYMATQPVSRDVAEGKPFSILSYALSFVGIPFFLVPLIMRNNEFSLFHAKQCLILWLGGIAASVIGVPLVAVCVGAILLPLAAIFLLVLNILGLIYAIKGETKALPLIGQWGIDWFKGLTKA